MNWKKSNFIGFISQVWCGPLTFKVFWNFPISTVGFEMPKNICKIHFSTVSALTYEVFFKFSSVVFSLHSIEIKFQVHSNFWHFNFNTWILICQVALTFNCRHFFHISNWIFEKSFSSEIYWRLLSNLNIKTSKLFFWAHVWSNIGIGLEDFQGQFQSSISAFLWWVEEQFLIYSPEMCGGTKPCNILRWESQTFHKKTIFQFQSLEWKVWDTGFKSLKNLMSTSNPRMEKLKMNKSKYCRKNLNIESLSEKKRSKFSKSWSRTIWDLKPLSGKNLRFWNQILE